MSYLINTTEEIKSLRVELAKPVKLDNGKIQFDQVNIVNKDGNIIKSFGLAHITSCNNVYQFVANLLKTNKMRVTQLNFTEEQKANYDKSLGLFKEYKRAINARKFSKLF